MHDIFVEIPFLSKSADRSLPVFYPSTVRPLPFFKSSAIWPYPNQLTLKQQLPIIGYSTWSFGRIALKRNSFWFIN